MNTGERADGFHWRIAAEGEHSPADVLITTDAGRLYRAQQEGQLATTESDTLAEQVPEALRDPEGHWYGLSVRARVVVYAPDRVDPSELSTYEALADEKWDDRICIRSSDNIYNQSLVGSLIAAHGEEGAEKWCRGLVANLARVPQGGDRDQIKAVAAGEGDVAVANSYYFARMLNGTDEEKAAAAKVAVVFPNQGGRGAHVNLSGIGVCANAPNKANAIRFIEYLTGEAAQEVFAAGNNEYPVVSGVKTVPALKAFGAFKEDKVNAAVFGKNNAAAIRIMDRAGWR